MANNNVFDNAVLLNLSFSRFGNSRKVSVAQLKAGVQADPGWMRAGKTLIESEQLKAISKLDGEINGYIRNILCLPFPLKVGMYVLPLANLERVTEYLNAMKEQREGLVQEFAAAYPMLLEYAETALGELFNAADYPAAGEIAACFAMSWSFLEFSAPGALRRHNPEAYRRAQEQAEEIYRNAVEEGVAALRTGFAEVVSRIAERLNPADGKKVVIRETLLGNLKEFIDSFDPRNNGLGDDADLARYVRQARDMVEGVDTPMLRSNTELQQRLGEQFSELKECVNGMVVEKGGRKMRWTEE
jgi:hypothetical protein